ncbi:MAG: DUF167 domain-containing protein [Coriobacteriales bacterium]|nr:DUF167 domain-containing protein [Coriobacteriales bacterium]
MKVTPRACANEVSGWADEERGVLAVRVTAPPEGGKANNAVIKLLSHELRIPQSAVRILKGSTARQKLVAIDVDPDRFADWCAALGGQS